MNTITLRRHDLDSAKTAESGFRLGGDQDQRIPLITQAISTLRRRKWVVLSAIVACLLGGLLITLLMTPRYTATATLEIQREDRAFTGVDTAQSKAPYMDQEFYETQYGLLRSEALARRVATKLRAYDDPAFFAALEPGLASQWFDGKRVRSTAPAREDRIRAAGSLLLKNFSLDPQRLSRLIVIRFSSPDPGLSKRVLDGWSAAFVEATLERRFEATSYARNFLEQRLAQLRERIDEGERKLVSYAGNEGIVNLPAGESSGEGGTVRSSERSLVADDLETLNQELARATADRVRAESRLRTARGANSESLQVSAINNLRQTRAELAAEYSRLMAQFEPDYPPARALNSQIAQLDRSIAQEEGRVSQSIRQVYDASVSREQALRRQVSGLKGDILDLRRRSIQYNILQRDVDTSRQLYDAMLQQYKEIGVAGGVGANNISVVDSAQLPLRPSSPRLSINLLIALAIGLLVGGAAAFVLEQIDQGVTDPSEVEPALGVPLLGTIPRIVDTTPSEAIDDRKSAASEAYISLQTNLGFATDHGVPRTLAVTSSRPAEGKSITSYALARALARSGRRVLLIDGDMRSPSVSSLLGISNGPGLSNYLAGDDNLGKFIAPSPYDNMSVMTAGPQPPSAAELLSSDRLARLITALETEFQHVIFDIPPVMGLADAPLIGSRVEGVVFVMESHSTQKAMAQVAVGRLVAANTNLLGVILTKFDSKRAHYGYGYSYGYGYGYGDTAGKK
jgi:polysaccharide biosynthesis transport protein